MASFNGLNAPSLAFNEASAAESGVITLYGSFQGNSAVPVVQFSVTATSCVGFRGNWFSAATRINTGQYRVQLTGLNIKTNLVAVNTTAGNNGQPNGLVMEPLAWVVSDGGSLSNLASTAGYQTSPLALVAACSRFDPGTAAGVGLGNATSAQTFDIFLINPVGGAATDATPTTRVCFMLAYKALAQTP